MMKLSAILLVASLFLPARASASAGAAGQGGANYGLWFILTICLFSVTAFTIKTVRSQATASRSWIGPLNSTSMVLGPLAMLFGDFLALYGGINAVSLLAAVALFFAGLTGHRYFRLQRTSTRSAVLATNVIAALVGSIAIVGNMVLISERFSRGAQGAAMVIGVGLPALPVFVSIATVIVLVRRARSPT